jgi:hypothetical protein
MAQAAIAMSASLLLIVHPMTGLAQLETYSAENVKAAYLYHFAGYVEWPADDKGPLSIGVIGDRQVVNDLQHILAGRTVQGRIVRVLEMKAGDDPSNIQVLYVGPGNTDDLHRLASLARQRHILLVSDAPGALELGSTINFVNVANRIRFEISVVSAKQAGLKLSSRLLSVAIKLKQSGGRGQTSMQARIECFEAGQEFPGS